MMIGRTCLVSLETTCRLCGTTAVNVRRVQTAVLEALMMSSARARRGEIHQQKRPPTVTTRNTMTASAAWCPTIVGLRCTAHVTESGLATDSLTSSTWGVVCRPVGVRRAHLRSKCDASWRISRMSLAVRLCRASLPAASSMWWTRATLNTHDVTSREHCWTRLRDVPLALAGKRRPISGEGPITDATRVNPPRVVLHHAFNGTERPLLQLVTVCEGFAALLERLARPSRMQPFREICLVHLSSGREGDPKLMRGIGRVRCLILPLCSVMTKTWCVEGVAESIVVRALMTTDGTTAEGIGSTTHDDHHHKVAARVLPMPAVRAGPVAADRGQVPPESIVIRALVTTDGTTAEGTGSTTHDDHHRKVSVRVLPMPVVLASLAGADRGKVPLHHGTFRSPPLMISRSHKRRARDLGTRLGVCRRERAATGRLQGTCDVRAEGAWTRMRSVAHTGHRPDHASHSEGEFVEALTRACFPQFSICRALLRLRPAPRPPERGG